jgi:hypothetical protein
MKDHERRFLISALPFAPRTSLSNVLDKTLKPLIVDGWFIMRKAFKKAFQDIKDVVDGKDESVSMFYVLSLL